MSTADYMPELAAALDRLVPAEAPAPAWDDVVGRVRRRRHLLGDRRVRFAIAVALLLLLLTGVATATYLLARGSGHEVSVGGLTILGAGALPNKIGLLPRNEAWIVSRGSNGRDRVVWRCPLDETCGELTSVAWSPTGRRLAFTIDALGAGTYIGVHILDVTTGTDHRISGRRVLGCRFPTDVVWAPDGVRLAYSCGGHGISVIDADGSHRTVVPTGPENAVEPTWSPDGRRIAYATARVLPGDNGNVLSSVYAVDLDGSHRRLIARHATAPAWSHDGMRIAYWAMGACEGIKLATPRGADVTPGYKAAACKAIGKPGMPAWSPDGTRLAVGADRGGLYVMNADGSRLRLVMQPNGRGVLGYGRPDWGPERRGDHPGRRPTLNCPGCN
jgi:Tol biopolymer transport system component